MDIKQTSRPLVVAIIGATGTGKSELATGLALRFHGSIVSADSMQVYRGMNIGTAKLSSSKRRNVPHALVDVITPDQNFSVAEYQRMALEAIDNIIRRRELPIIVGGTGLYVRAVLDGYEFIPEKPDMQLRTDLRNLSEADLRVRLRERDAEAESTIAAHDTKRLERALEIALQSGNLPSDVKRRRHGVPWRICRIGLRMERNVLYQRLDARVDQMLAAGMEDEVRALLASGLGPQCTAMQGIGYKELAAWIQGGIAKDEAIELWKRRTRNYAKRQETWFRRDPDVQWIDATRRTPEDVLDMAGSCVALAMKGEDS